MPETTENIVNMDLTTSLEQMSSLIEQLAKAYVELEAQEGASCDIVHWKDIEAHFRNLESVVKKKLEDLEAKEKEVTEKETLLAEREALVTAKEQDLLERVQELKDDAVAAIMEAKVSSSVNDENGEGVRAQAVAEELTQFCEEMDSKGLLNYVMENQNNLSSVCRKQLPIVLVNATEPARLVLNALDGFFPPDETTQNGEEKDDTALHGMRQCCLLLMEALFAFLAKADSPADNYLNPEIKQHAKAIADEWKPKLLAPENTDTANGKSLEARAFLRLLVTFRIASEFDEEELCKYVLATVNHRQATELCHCLELSHKIPGIVETLMENGKNMEAVNFILSFKLSEAFPPVPLLKAYLKEQRRKLQGNGEADTQNDVNARELTAIKVVMRYVKEYNLEAEYPLEPLRKRLVQLQNVIRDKRRNRVGKYRREAQAANRVSREPEARVSERGRQDPQPYTGLTEYSHAVPSAYSYPVSSQPAYAAQANDQTSYNYPVSSQPTYAAQANDQTSYNYPVSSQPTYAGQSNDQTSYSYPVSSQTTYATQANDQTSYSYPVSGQTTYAAQANDQTSYSHPVSSQTTYSAQAYYYAQGEAGSAPYSAEVPTYGAYLQPPQHPYV